MSWGLLGLVSWAEVDKATSPFKVDLFPSDKSSVFSLKSLGKHRGA